MPAQSTTLNSRQRAALAAYTPSHSAPRLPDPAAWHGLSCALRQSSTSGIFDVLRQAKPTHRTRRSVAPAQSKPSAPDLETRLFALFAE